MICLDANRANVAKWNAELAAIESRSFSDKAQSRKEFASDGGDFTMLGPVEGHFIDLKIAKDSFLTDSALITGLDVEVAPIWKTRYAPTVGITLGSVYGPGISTMYVTQDSFATLQPFVIDTEDIKIPKMSLTQDPEVLEQRTLALGRQAEALRLAEETYLMNFLCQQPIGTDIPTSVVNQMGLASPYSGKTVYVADPGVQSGTYETSNNINMSSEGGLTLAVAEAIANQSYLSKREPRTVHIPVQGLPWRTLWRVASLVSTAYPSGTANPDLKLVPPSKWEEMWNANFEAGVVLNWGGKTLKFKSNNVLPEGYAVITTNQPGAQIFNIKSRRISLDYTDDPKDPYFDSHYEKIEIALCVPDPWVRNTWFLSFGDTSF